MSTTNPCPFKLILLYYESGIFLIFKKKKNTPNPKEEEGERALLRVNADQNNFLCLEGFEVKIQQNITFNEVSLMNDLWAICVEALSTKSHLDKSVQIPLVLLINQEQVSSILSVIIMVPSVC